MLFHDKVIRTLRVKNVNKPGVLGALCVRIGALGATLGEIKTNNLGRHYIVRDIDVIADNETHLKEILAAVQEVDGVTLLEVNDEVLKAHEHGKTKTESTHPVVTVADLRRVYTPGVANVCRSILKNPNYVDLYTSISNSVAIVTDGTRVLGLGDIGPLAAMPVMEGKAALMQQFAGISAVPILLNTKDPDEIVETVIRISPTFAGIQLEDIAAPKCFDIEERLIETLSIPVMHDDQHGTALVTLASVINACKISALDIFSISIGQIGLGAAGMAIATLLMWYTGNPVVGTDVNEEAKRRFIRKGGKVSTLEEIMGNVDVVVATTGVPNLIEPHFVRKGQVILALSNPDPEIDIADALERGAAFAADGRSVNNLLGFPGIFRGSLDAKARRITHEMYVAAALAIAARAEGEDLVPSPLDRKVHWAVARSVAKAAMECGVAGKTLDDDYFESS